MPGPSGTVARYVTYRRYGISTEDFATSYVVNSSVSNVLPLVLPSIGLALLSTQEDVPGRVWTLALVGLGVSLALLVLAWLIVRSEPFARRFGARLGRLLNSLRGLGVDAEVLTAVEVFAVYTVVRLATLVEITPGNVGIAETPYISALDWAAGGQDADAIVAAVFVFRMFTYLGPILVGGVCTVLLSRRFRREDAEAAS